MTREEEIRARCEEATPGPWNAGRGDVATIVDGYESKWIYAGGNNKYLAVASGYEVTDWNEVMANARFIAHAREDIPYLLDENARLRAELEAELYAIKTDIEAGRLVRLPCAVGDTVYIITENYFDCPNCPHGAEAKYNTKINRVCCDLEDRHCPYEVEMHVVEGFEVSKAGVLDPGKWGYEGLEYFNGVDGKWYHTEAEALAAMKEDAHAIDTPHP